MENKLNLFMTEGEEGASDPSSSPEVEILREQSPKAEVDAENGELVPSIKYLQRKPLKNNIPESPSNFVSQDVELKIEECTDEELSEVEQITMKEDDDIGLNSSKPLSYLQIRENNIAENRKVIMELGLIQEKPKKIKSKRKITSEVLTQYTRRSNRPKPTVNYK